MVISHENKYVFVEFPRTGSTSISRELVQCYGGKRILRKHSSYNEFLKKATPEERKYFVFSSDRNSDWLDADRLDEMLREVA